jgi:DNA repair photolyase
MAPPTPGPSVAFSPPKRLLKASWGPCLDVPRDFYRNDADHPTLSRARALSQSSLEDEPGAPDPGRGSYGACRILESTGAGGLTDFTMGNTVTGQAWSVNPYTGCAHACSYCYVPDTLKAERRNWGSRVIVKKDLPTRLALAMQRSHRHTVYFSTATDPYQPAEAEHRITRKCLQVLVRKDWPVEVLTRSPLVTRDLDLLSQLSQVRVGLSIPMLDDGLRKALEPNAPPIAARLRTLRKLSDAGIPTFANYTPACPPTTHDAGAVARVFLDAGAQWVNSKGWQRVETTMAPVWERLRTTEWEWVTRFFAKQAPQQAWHEELSAAFRKVGLPLSTPFFNPPFEWMMPGTPTKGVQADFTEEGLRRFAPLPMVAAGPGTRARRTR